MPFLNNNQITIKLRRGELNQWLSDSCKQSLEYSLMSVNPNEEANKTLGPKIHFECAEQFKRMMNYLSGH